ncbi:MAG: hypothetical protein K9G13_01520 [Aquiluna sp.]|nr:hypothetical protein [Aquiluna sp.]MCF8545206.1 hypothetical protein [Aquiluna sp.]
MTEFLTRRQLREAERKGINLAPQVAPEDTHVEVSAKQASSIQDEQTISSSNNAPSEAELEVAKASFSEAKAAADNAINLRSTPSAPAFSVAEPEVVATEISQPETRNIVSEPVLTRKQLRELERTGKLPEAVNTVASETAEPVSVVTSREVTPHVVQDSVVRAVEPELSLPTSAEIEAIDSTSENAILDAAELNLDEPSIEFSGANLFAEPSTQSIVLDVAPEAISLPIETGEITVTGSISVLAETATGAITGGLDGLVLDSIDQQDAVTGIISTVEPISAIDIINERANVGVVPKSVLRKGWWRPYALGLIGLLMAIAAILATITIINALGA